MENESLTMFHMFVSYNVMKGKGVVGPSRKLADESASTGFYLGIQNKKNVSV
jgi:hypothetical protein